MNELIKHLEGLVRDAETKRDKAHFEYSFNGYAYHCVARAEGRLIGVRTALIAAKEAARSKPFTVITE